MKKFKVIGNNLTIYTGDEDYCNAQVMSGGAVEARDWGYCTILIYGSRREMSFNFNDPEVYDAIVSAFSTGETIGVVLNAPHLT